MPYANPFSHDNSYCSVGQTLTPRILLLVLAPTMIVDLRDQPPQPATLYLFYGNESQRVYSLDVHLL